MRQLIAASATILVLAVPATAQTPRHEFGVDVAAMYSKVGSGCATDCGVFSIMTPVDVRVGWLSRGALSFETRFGLAYATGGGGHVLTFSPGLNLLYRMGAPEGPNGMMGMYLTGGVGIAYTDIGISGGGGGSDTQFSINAGVGNRSALGNAAFRPELFVRFDLESDNSPSTFNLGARLGLSFFHGAH